MNRLQKAIAIVQSCEIELQSLMEEALAGREYAELPALAAVGAGLARVLSEIDGEQPAAGAPPAAEKVVGELVARAQRAKPTRYPKFVREATKLVKIGWSKADKSEYEHKAPLTAVSSVLRALNKRGKKDTLIRLDDLLPTKDDDGQEIPSYQVYLVVAWLRDLGLLQRQGNDGYQISKESNRQFDLDEILGRTAEREYQ